MGLKKTVIAVVALLLVLLVGSPQLTLAIQTAGLKRVYDQEANAILPLVSQLAGRSTPGPNLSCTPSYYYFFSTVSNCDWSADYQYTGLPLSPDARASTVSAAARLDQLLKQRGWQLDRPGDPITTIAGSVPAEPLAPDTSSQAVPMHKNVGPVSCNLSITFLGPTDGDSPGIVLPQFTCRQDIRYFELHLVQKHFINV